MSEQKATFTRWGSEVLHQWRAGRTAAASEARETAREPYHLEGIASCACSGYFHMGYVVDSFVFTPELPFKG
jgi:hypothetical protein